MRRLMILGARSAQLPVYRKARDMGLKILGADNDAAAPGLEYSDDTVVCDLADSATLLAAARRHDIDGAMTLGADYPMPALARICEALRLSGPGIATVARATHKASMRRAFERAQLPCPRYRHVLTLESARDVARAAGTSLIFKPALGSGGRGVTRVAADAPLAAVDAAFVHADAHSREGQGVIVEDFVDGPEFSVETITSRGVTQVIAVTDKHTSGAPCFVELGHDQPSRWDADAQRLLREVAIRAVQALGIDDAAAHTEVRLGAQGPVLMECAARAGGGCIVTQLVPLSTGVDMVRACIELALGGQPDLRPVRQGQPAAIRFLTAAPGTVRAIEGVEQARSMAGVVEIVLYVAPGHQVPELKDATGRCGHVVASAPDLDSAVRRAEDAARAVHVRTAAA